MGKIPNIGAFVKDQGVIREWLMKKVPDVPDLEPFMVPDDFMNPDDTTSANILKIPTKKYAATAYQPCSLLSQAPFFVIMSVVEARLSKLFSDRWTVVALCQLCSIANGAQHYDSHGVLIRKAPTNGILGPLPNGATNGALIPAKTDGTATKLQTDMGAPPSELTRMDLYLKLNSRYEMKKAAWEAEKDSRLKQAIATHDPASSKPHHTLWSNSLNVGVALKMPIILLQVLMPIAPLNDKMFKGSSALPGCPCMLPK